MIDLPVTEQWEAIHIKRSTTAKPEKTPLSHCLNGVDSQHNYETSPIVLNPQSF